MVSAVDVTKIQLTAQGFHCHLPSALKARFAIQRELHWLASPVFQQPEGIVVGLQLNAIDGEQEIAHLSLNARLEKR